MTDKLTAAFDTIAAAGYTAVKLPEADCADDGDGQMFFDDYGIRVDLTGTEPGQVYPPGRELPVPPRVLRDRAAALLAAAAAAESRQRRQNNEPAAEREKASAFVTDTLERGHRALTDPDDLTLALNPEPLTADLVAALEDLLGHPRTAEPRQAGRQPAQAPATPHPDTVEMIDDARRLALYRGPGRQDSTLLTKLADTVEALQSENAARKDDHSRAAQECAALKSRMQALAGSPNCTCHIDTLGQHSPQCQSWLAQRLLAALDAEPTP
ncbi:hypothetical protein MUG78_16995 [Gordonia alkaliphila]|uniref:hypothetical protein n=1 Tax=Gordonia alkaliphila TaxID=1053547 RepID=UPI001FF4D996|nr:hypothetical protein [Gordonia alkaliphila]MCK0441099.1 hypothetical protein [Gordonia alkaliphila]